MDVNEDSGEKEELQTGLSDSDGPRCNRTDGKKWRCNHKPLDGQKYCSKHMHRGQHRSKKYQALMAAATAAAACPQGFHQSVGNFLMSHSQGPGGGMQWKDLGRLFEMPRLDFNPGSFIRARPVVLDYLEQTPENAAVAGFVPDSRSATVDRLRVPVDVRGDAARMSEYETLQKRLIERDGTAVDSLWGLACELGPELSVASAAGPLSSATCQGSAVEDSTCYSSAGNQSQRVSSWDSDNSSISSHASGKGPMLGMSKVPTQRTAGVALEEPFSAAAAAPSLPLGEIRASGFLGSTAGRGAALAECADEAGAIRELAGAGPMVASSNLDLDELLAVFGNPMPSAKQQGRTPIARMWSQMSGKPAPSSWSAPTALGAAGGLSEATEYSCGGTSFMSMGVDELPARVRGSALAPAEATAREDTLASLQGNQLYTGLEQQTRPPPRPSASLDMHGYAGPRGNGAYGAGSQPSGMLAAQGHGALGMTSSTAYRKGEGMDGIGESVLPPPPKQSHMNELESIIRGRAESGAGATPFAERKRQNVRFDTLAELMFPSLRNYGPQGARPVQPPANQTSARAPLSWDTRDPSAPPVAAPRSYTEIMAGLEQQVSRAGSFREASMNSGMGGDLCSMASSAIDGSGSLSSGDSQASTDMLTSMYHKRKPVENPFLQGLPNKLAVLEAFQRGQALTGGAVARERHSFDY